MSNPNQYVLNPPPNWPPNPPGWTPPPGWQPDPTWPPAPAGWNFWRLAGAAPAAAASIPPADPTVARQDPGSPFSPTTAGGQSPNDEGRSWFARHKVLTGVAGAFLFLMFVGAVSGGGDDGAKSTDVNLAATDTEPEDKAAADKDAAEKAAEDKAAAEKAAADKDAAEKAAADKAAAEKAAADKAAAEKAAAEKAAAGTVSQQNAVRKADEYLAVMAFSRSGLIKQLAFDGFSTADATWGVDKQNADWNEQAAKKGEEYLAVMSFSRSGLIKQLMFDGFTQAQADYGATQNGL